MALGQKPTILRAGIEYDPTNEERMRRDLEDLLLRVLSYVLSVSNGVDTQASHTHKRHQYMPPLGES